MDVQYFIPKSKMDTDLIEELSRNEYPFYKPILNDLFEWMRDLNWPVAKKIIPLLVNAKNDVIPVVKNILHSDDDIWKYWTLSQVVLKMDISIVNELKPDLDRIKNIPTKGERFEEVNLIAENILNRLN